MGSKTIKLRLWTPDRKHICLVRDLPELEPLPDGGHKDEGWGMVGGGQKDQDLKDYGQEARKMVGVLQIPEDHLHEIATAIRELGEETGLTPDKITINPKSRNPEKRGKDHELIVYDAIYYTDDVSEGLKPNDPKKQIAEVRWVNFMDLIDGEVDGLKIYKTHMRIINDEPNPYPAR